MRDFLMPQGLRIPLNGPQDKPEAYLEVVIQTRVDSRHRFSEEPITNGLKNAGHSRKASPSEQRKSF